MKINIIYLIVAVVLASCSPGKPGLVQVQQKNLYDIVSNDDIPSINGFRELTLFADDYDNTVWVSPEKQCVTLSKEANQTFSGKYSLHVKWDKITGGCKWLGIGFGWNNWLPKDMSEIISDAAVQMQVKSVKGSFSNLPVAFAFEDYAGVQAFYGFNASLVKGKFSDTEWTTITIPLKNFPFASKDADLAKMKQFIIQLEAEGDIYLDDIRLVPLEK